MTNRIENYEAVFPLVARAEAFAARLAENDGKGNYIVPGTLKQKGRKVTFQCDNPHADERNFYESLEWSLMECAGYYGNDQRRKATVNGKTCPMSY